MMERILIKDLKPNELKKVSLFGWIHNIKRFKDFSFVYLRDRSGVVQMIIDDADILPSLKLESSVKVIGEIKVNEKSPNGLDIIVESLKVVGEAKYDLLPFSINGRDINA